MNTKVAICPQCKGKGRRPYINWGLAILSLGATAVVDMAFDERCKTCKGQGRVEVADG